jgi:hypothetical protein
MGLSIELKELPRHFICEEGYIYYLKNGREIKLIPQEDKRKRVLILLGKNKYLLVHLMVKYFIKEFKTKDKFKFKKTKNLEIPLSGIKIITRKELKQDESKLVLWNCNIKSSSANSRSAQFITQYDVFKVLEMFDYKCIYCQDDLMPNEWHLDHFIPLSRNGTNDVSNLVASCAICNTMKGALNGFEFHKLCNKIYNNFLLKIS